MDNNKIDLTKATKVYHLPFEAWYADTVKAVYKFPHINISLDSNDGGTYGEFTIEWNNIGIQIHAFEDSWRILPYVPELVSLLVQVSESDVKPTISEFAKMLDEVGFTDKTERVTRS